MCCCWFWCQMWIRILCSVSRSALITVLWRFLQQGRPLWTCLTQEPSSFYIIFVQIILNLEQTDEFFSEADIPDWALQFVQVRASPKLVRKFFPLGCLVSVCTTFPILLPQHWIRKYCLNSFKHVFNGRHHSKHHSLCKILTTKWFCSGQSCLKLTTELRLLFFFAPPFSCLSVKHKLL